MTKVKICGITNTEDALLSAKFGADAIGFNFYPKSPRYVAPETAREIVEQVPANVLKVGVFVNESLDKIVEIARAVKLNALQLHGEETPEFAAELKAKTNLEIIKAFRVSPEFKPEDVLRYDVDAVLLDAYSRHEHGGTGETFDWEIAKKVREIFPKTYLAGGLKHENIRHAIWETKPFAVDVCSGIENKKGKKDKIQLINFITKAKRDSKDVPVHSLYDLLNVMHQRLAIYVGAKSLTFLHIFLIGFQSASVLSNSSFDTGKFFTEFQQYVMNYYKDERAAFHWSSIILENVKMDEVTAVDVFFALLEEFKLEKEDLSNE